MFTFEQTKAGYAHMLDSAKIGSTHVDAAALAKATAERIIPHKAVYQRIEAATGVPWWVVAALHYREGNLNFGTYLGNGQSLARATTEVPAGRGPFTGPDAFVDGAIDALTLQLRQVRAAGIIPPKVWTVEFGAWFEEAFNGQGYFKLNVNSPYLWNWTTLYNGGKYIADHVFSRTVFDVQGGCVAILKELTVLDPTIVLPRENAPIVLKEPPMATPTPTALPGLPNLAALASIHTEVGVFLSIAPTVLPVISTFLPGAKVLSEALPILTAIHNLAGDLEAAGGDPAKMIAAVQSRLGEILAAVKTITPAA